MTEDTRSQLEPCKAGSRSAERHVAKLHGNIILSAHHHHRRWRFQPHPQERRLFSLPATFYRAHLIIWLTYFVRTSMYVHLPGCFYQPWYSPFLRYSAVLLRRPMITQCITAAVLFGAGDIVAQQAIEGKGKEHDVSCCFISPFCS